MTVARRLRALVRNDRSSTPRAKAAPSRDRAAVAETRRAVRRDLKRDKETRAQPASIEKTIKKEQAPAKKTSATARPPHPAPASH